MHLSLGGKLRDEIGYFAFLNLKKIPVIVQVICIVLRNQAREACSLIRLSSRNFECVAPSSQGKAIMDAG